MKATEVLVNVGVTKNMGNYESMRLDYQMRVVLEEDEKPGPAIDHARGYLFEKMKKDVKEANGGKAWLK